MSQQNRFAALESARSNISGKCFVTRSRKVILEQKKKQKKGKRNDEDSKVSEGKFSMLN